MEVPPPPRAGFMLTPVGYSRLHGEYLLIKNMKNTPPPFPLDISHRNPPNTAKYVTSQKAPNYRKQTMSYTSNVQIPSALIFSYVRVLLIANMDVNNINGKIMLRCPRIIYFNYLLQNEELSWPSGYRASDFHIPEVPGSSPGPAVASLGKALYPHCLVFWMRL